MSVQPFTIPFMRLDRQFSAYRQEFLDVMLPVLESGVVLQGSITAQFERSLASKVGLEHAISCGSGTDAMIIGLAALGLRKGSRIAVPAFTFVATAAPVLHAGCVPIFVDCDTETGLADEHKLLELIETRAVDAIIVVHLYGQLANLDRIGPAAKRAGIVIIEDAAQALGATRNGMTFGGHSKFSTVSFDPMKVVGAFGSGGALLTADADFANLLRRLRYHGHDGKGRYLVAGFNSQLANVQAAALTVKLGLMAKWQARRAQIAAIFDEKLMQAPHSRRMRTLPENGHNWHKYVLWIDRRASVQSGLAADGIQTKVHYDIPLHRQPLFADVAKLTSCPNAETAAKHVLSLPMYPELTDAEAEYVAVKTRAMLEAAA